MNLSWRVKLDREADARGGSRKLPATVTPPELVPPTTPTPEAEQTAPAPAVAAPPPKMPGFVRPPAEKRATTSPVPLPPPTTKASGKVMSRNLTVTPKR